MKNQCGNSSSTTTTQYFKMAIYVHNFEIHCDTNKSEATIQGAAFNQVDTVLPLQIWSCIGLPKDIMNHWITIIRGAHYCREGYVWLAISTMRLYTIIKNHHSYHRLLIDCNYHSALMFRQDSIYITQFLTTVKQWHFYINEHIAMFWCALNKLLDNLQTVKCVIFTKS